MIAFSVILNVFSSLLILKKLPVEKKTDQIMAFYLLFSSNIIICFEVSSLFNKLGSISWFLVIQTSLLLFAICFFKFINYKPPVINYPIKQKETTFKDFIGKNKFLFVYGLLVTLVYLFLGFLSIYFPQNTTDSMYNHLSRLAHWLQQGSLKPYDSPNYFGQAFPFNNSLLIGWPILFFKTDIFAGLVQLFAAIFLAISVFSLSTSLGNSKTSSAFSAIFLLSFPIILFESITAQNDILVAAFFCIGLYFFITGFQNRSKAYLLLSAIAISLALGTKQYVFYLLPGVILLIVYYLVKNKAKPITRLVVTFSIYSLACFLVLGSYSYIQNTIVWKNPAGPIEKYGIIKDSSNTNLVQKYKYISSRLAYQFISCEGLPLNATDSCIAIKTKIFTPLFASEKFNIESHEYLLETNCDSECFSLSKQFPLNEESSWFGFLSWIVLLPSLFLFLFKSIKAKKIEPILLLITVLIYFSLVTMQKIGWDPYSGRYFIISMAIVMPFTACLFSMDTFLKKMFTVLITLCSLFVMVFSINSNASRPLVTKYTMLNLQRWGMDNSIFVQKAAYKLTPYFLDTKSAFDLTYYENRTFGNSQMRAPLLLVETDVPTDSTLGIISQDALFMDYLFFGKHFSRKVYNILDYKNSKELANNLASKEIEFLLVAPKIIIPEIEGFDVISSLNDWQLLQKK